MLVLNPLPDNEYRTIQAELMFALATIESTVVMPGCNVSDREEDWLNNYRCPDVVVYLPANRAKDCDTHMLGGPDIAVEIVSPGEDPRLKLDFYAKVNTRELLIVDRYPWAIEQYTLQNGAMVLAGTSNEANAAVLTSSVLPLTYQMLPGANRPAIHITHTVSGQIWTA